MSDSADTIRLDIWLWRARFFKTRTLSAQHVTKRGIRVYRGSQMRAVRKPGGTICVGDILTFSCGGRIQTVEVLGFGLRRGPASEAQTLYRPIEVEQS